MTNPELTDRILHQGRALVRAIEALGTIQPTGPLERALAACKHRLGQWRVLRSACKSHQELNMSSDPQ